MRLDSKNIPEKTRLIHSISYKKIFGSATDINLQNTNTKEFIENLAWKMVKTCITDGGVGLAAPQIGIPKKLIVIREFKDPQLWDFTDIFNVYINPKCNPVKDSGDWVFEESCLSVPGQNYEISRINKINVSYWRYNENDKLEFIEETLDGYQARIFLHENDHLLGISIVGRYNKQIKTAKKITKEELLLQERNSFLNKVKLY